MGDLGGGQILRELGASAPMHAGQPACYMNAAMGRSGAEKSNPDHRSAVHVDSFSPLTGPALRGVPHTSAALPEQRSIAEDLFALDQDDDSDSLSGSLSDSLSDSLSWDEWHVPDSSGESSSEEFFGADASFVLDAVPRGVPTSTDLTKPLPRPFVHYCPDEGLQGQPGQGTSDMVVPPSTVVGLDDSVIMRCDAQVTESDLSETQKALRRLADYHRGPNIRATQQMRTEKWNLVEALLLSDATEAFERRPVNMTGPGPCVFREETPTRREKQSDRWQNSGGKKGSTLWPADHPRIRCQYGKVSRGSGEPLRYHAYTYIKQAGLNETKETVSNRRIYVVNGSAEYACGSSRWSAPMLPSDQQSQTLFAKFDAQLATLKANASNLEEPDNLKALYRLLSDANLHKDLLSGSLRYKRPRFLEGPVGHCIYLETTACQRARGRGGINAFDRWVNLGGKRAVRELGFDGGRLQRRAGRVVKRNKSNEPAMGKHRSAEARSEAVRYVQYSVADEYPDVKLYHAYTTSSQSQPPETLPLKRERQLSNAAASESNGNPGREHSTSRKTRRYQRTHR